MSEGWKTGTGELAFSLRMSSWLAWARESSHISAPGIMNNIGVTFWREDPGSLFALLPKISESTKSTTKQLSAGHLRVQPQGQGTRGEF